MSIPTMDTLVKALLDGDQAEALAEMKNLRESGIGQWLDYHRDSSGAHIEK